MKNNDISISGKKGVMVMVDDKLIKLTGDDLINFLKLIKSDDIKAIEVITNPPAKYDAEGNSGMINIKLKKAKKDSWNTSITSKFLQGNFPTLSGGVAFQYNKNKINLSTGVNYRNGSILNYSSMKAWYPDKDYLQELRSKYCLNNLGIQLATEYDISDHFTSNIQYKGNFDKPSDIANTKSIFYNYENVLFPSTFTNSTDIIKNILNNINYQLSYKIDTLGKKLSLNLDFFDHEKYNDRTFSVNSYTENNNPENNQNIGNQKRINYSLNIDMEHPLKWININYGGKLSITKTNNELLFYNLIEGKHNLDKSRSNTFSFRENTQSIYASGEKYFGDKWTIKLGLRLENSDTKGYSETLSETNTNSYTKLFPTAYISYTPDKKNNFNINYGRRISRPPFHKLNPFRTYNNLFTYQEGNPYLKPSFSNNFEFNYTYKSNLNFQLYYNSVSDGIDELTSVSPNTPNVFTKPMNYIQSNEYGGNISYTLKKGKWLELTSSFDYKYIFTSSSIPQTNQNLNGSQAFFELDSTFNVSNSISFNIYYFYEFEGVDSLDLRSSSNELDFIFKYTLPNKRFQLSVAANDIFHSNKTTYTTYTNNIKQKYTGYYDNRDISVSLKYDFGNNKIKNSQLSSKNMEEQNRLQ